MATQRGMTAAQKLVVEYYKAKLNLMHVLNARWAAASAIDLFQKPYARPRRKEPPIWKEAKRLRLSSGEHQLAGYHWLPKEPNGQKLLIVHGFAGSCKSFEKYIYPSLKKGYEVLAYDAPGHGKSNGSRLNLIIYKWVLEDIIRHHQGFDAYLAHSLGGMSLMLALDALGHKQQNKIALVAPLVEVRSATQNFSRFLQLPANLQALFVEELEKRAGHKMDWFSLPRLLREHQGQVLWIHDRLDDTTPFDDVEPAIPHLPGHVELMVTEGLGHSRIYRDNKVRKRILECW